MTKYFWPGTVYSNVIIHQISDDIASESDSCISCDENAYIDSQSEPEEIIYGAVGGYDTVSGIVSVCKHAHFVGVIDDKILL